LRIGGAGVGYVEKVSVVNLGLGGVGERGERGEGRVEGEGLRRGEGKGVSEETEGLRRLVG